MNSDGNIVLLGFMGTGKSAVGKILAQRLGRTFVDLDSLVEAQTGATIRELFQREGEPGFRRRERTAVREVAARRGLVVATGGGVVRNSENLRDLEKTGTLVCLRALPETILTRIGTDTGRPLLQGEEPPLERIRTLLAERESRYAAIRLQVSTDGLTPQEVADRVEQSLQTEPIPGTT